MELIDKKQAMNHIENQYQQWGDDYDILQAIGDLEDMETVDAVPVRHGTWRHYERMLTCSECGTVFDDDIMEYFGEEVPKYCPECGARMDL